MRDRRMDHAAVGSRGMRMTGFASAVVLLLFWGSTASGEPAGEGLVARAVDAVKAELQAVVTERQKDGEWLWVRAESGDDQYPIAVDFLVSRKVKPSRAIYMLPPSGVNFAGVFAGAGTNGLAHFLAQHGYLVVGITAREDLVPAAAADSTMADWGLEKHREDVRKVVATVQPPLRLPHDMLGYSFGGVVAMDYCGVYADDPSRLLLLDIHTMDPSNAIQVATAGVMYEGYRTLLGMSVYVDPSLGDLRDLLDMSAVWPQGDSGVPREWFGLPAGNFTLEGMLHFWLIYSGVLPGIHSPFTGLPRDWPLVMSTASGWYLPSANPVDDQFALYFTQLSRLRETAAVMGSGKIPLAFLRDVTSATGHCGDYRINWAGITPSVRWVNAELGYGSFQYGTELIRAAGNVDVQTTIVPEYGNADVVFSETAAQDVWRLLLD